jgi:hypothetical protein
LICGAGGERGDAKGFCVYGGGEDERWEVGQNGDGGDAGGDAEGFCVDGDTEDIVGSAEGAADSTEKGGAGDTEGFVTG